MSADAGVERARRWLSEQIEQLKSLRNARTRDQDFKQWRQSTLTIIQRIWPGDSKRSARFRRIPFSPPSTQADARETRDYYERGCAEAAQLLTACLEEIEAKGLPAEVASARPASLDPGVAEDDFPTLELRGDAPATGKQADGPSNAVSVRGGAAASRDRDGNVPRSPGSERRRRHKKGGPRRRLRDMLGLDALEKLAGEPELAETPREDAPRARERHEDDVPEIQVARSEAPDDARSKRGRSDDDLLAAADAADAPSDWERAPVNAAKAEQDLDAEPDDQATHATEDDAGDVDGSVGNEEHAQSTADFLSASPVFKSEGRPVRRARRDPKPPAPEPEDLTPAPLTSSTAIAVAAIAAEVSRLGVPEGHRARTRASLISLAQLVEDGELDWDGLRGAVAFAMEFPPIGRRLVPLLIPFLDRAA